MKTSQSTNKKAIGQPVANERKPITIAKTLHEKLKFVAIAQGKTLMDLLDSMAERQILAWEKLHHVSVDELLAEGTAARSK